MTKGAGVAALKGMLFVALMITALIIASPFYPVMPSTGLDPSWTYAINQAVADKLAFGREVIFTFGPYGALYTRVFHPGTDVMAMSAGLFLGLCFGTVLILLARRSLLWGLCLLFVTGGQMFSRDSVFACYGPLLVVAISNEAWKASSERRGVSPLMGGVLAILLFAVGLPPLIKGSLIAIAAASSLAAFLIFLSARAILLAAAALLLPLAGVMTFWLFAGQSLADLPTYFLNMAQIVSGYTEAHALDGDFREVVVFLAASAGIFWVLATMPAARMFRLALMIAFGAFLFSAFKNGFVRHADGHAFYAAAALVLTPVALNLSVFKPGKIAPILWVAVVGWFVIDGAYIRSLPELLFFNLFKTYAEGAEGFRERILRTVDLNEAFATRIASIAAEAQFPKLDGATDIYNYNQSYLLASGAHWRPRPVLQSYSADTARLARLDRDFLASPRAADNILFRLETIDGRFPSMDDGASWPNLFTYYALAAYEPNDYLLLKHVKGAVPGQAKPLVDGNFELGHDVELPSSNVLLYAELEVRPTLFGVLASLLYKPAVLGMSVTLASGQTRNFRIDSRMASAGFLLSPFVENTTEFGYLFGNLKALGENEIRSVRVNGDSLYWRADYQLKLTAIAPPASSATKPESNPENRIEDRPPGDLPVSEVATCEGAIDSFNGQPIAQANKIANLISIEGWMTVSGKDGKTPDDVYVTLRKPGGSVSYIKARKAARPDIVKHFGYVSMGDPGFLISFDASSLEGDLTLGLARKVAGRIELCGNFHACSTVRARLLQARRPTRLREMGNMTRSTTRRRPSRRKRAAPVKAASRL